MAGLAILVQGCSKLTGKSQFVIWRKLADEYSKYIRECFDQGKAPGGGPWKFTTLGKKPFQGGNLKGQASKTTVTGSGFYVTITHPGANVHMYGATIVPVRAKMLRYQLGNVTVYSHRSVVPARPYLPDGLPDDLAARYDVIIDKIFNDALNG